jgi:hypothetical protein
MLISPAAASADNATYIGKQGIPGFRAPLYMQGSIGPVGGWGDVDAAINELQQLTAGTTGAASLVREGARLIAVPVLRFPGALERAGNVLTGRPNKLEALHLTSADARLKLTDAILAVIDGAIIIKPTERSA